jgi:protein ImuA
VVVMDRSRTFYPPAAAAWGIDLEQLIVVQPRSAREELWAAVQSLRSPVVAAVWAAIQRLDDRAFRRLQLAAQVGRALGLLLRPASARGQPSWADVRLLAEPARQGDKERGRQGEHHGRLVSLSPCFPVSLSSSVRRVQVRVLRSHGGRPGSSACLEIDETAHAIREVNSGVSRFTHSTVATNDDAHPLPVVAELADPTARPFSAGA